MAEVDRREALFAIGSAALALMACGGAKPPLVVNAEPPPPPFHLEPLTDVIAGAGLVWMFHGRLREVFALPDLIPAVDLVLPAARLDAFARAHGGVDLRQAHELAIGDYGDAMLFAARSPIDPARLEASFRERVDPLDGRAVDAANGPDGRPFAPITRLWGTARGRREQLAIFGRDAVALERGRFGVLRAAEAFAEEKLKRAKPALRTEPLEKVAELLGDAPLRGFAPGPFEGEWASGFGGLMRAATAVGVAASPGAARTGSARARVDLHVVLTGAWDEKAAAASDRLSAVADTLAQDGLGKLCGLDQPIDPPKSRYSSDFIALDVGLDASKVARGIRAATEASIREIMTY